VETEGQLRILLNLGCDQIQGFLLARPMNKEKAEALLLSHQASLLSPIGPGND